MRLPLAGTGGGRIFGPRDAALHVEQHHGGLAGIHGLAFGLDEIMHQLLCTPLQVGSQGFGALYADSRRPGPAITELDLQLIESVSAHAAAVLTARRLRGDVAALLRDAADAGLQAPRWDELLSKG